MIGLLWVVLHVLCIGVEGDLTSASSEALAQTLTNNGAAATGNTANLVGQTGGQINTQPLLARLFQLGGSLYIQPLGPAQGQQLFRVQQGGIVLVGQAGEANLNPPGLMAQTATGGPVTLYAVLQQKNAGRAKQGALLSSKQVQLIPLSVLNNQQQADAAVGRQAAARTRFQRSLAARLLRTQKDPAKTEMSDEDDDDGSGLELEESQVN